MAREARPEIEARTGTEAETIRLERSRRRRFSLVAAAVLVTAVILIVLSQISFDGDPEEPAAGSSLGLEDVGAREDDPAPDFTIPLFGGDTFGLSDHFEGDGRPVFLNLWASWCFPCRVEMPAIDAASGRHPGVRFIGVAVQDQLEPAQEFVDEVGVTYLLGFDQDGVVDRGYSPLGLPASYIISESGVILERIFGQVHEEQIDAKLAQYFGG